MTYRLHLCDTYVTIMSRSHYDIYTYSTRKFADMSQLLRLSTTTLLLLLHRKKHIGDYRGIIGAPCVGEKY